MFLRPDIFSRVRNRDSDLCLVPGLVAVPHRRLSLFPSLFVLAWVAPIPVDKELPHSNWQLLLRQLNMSILCGISNLWMTEVTTDMCRSFDESPHK
jgi:hypothetical protein